MWHRRHAAIEWGDTTADGRLKHTMSRSPYQALELALALSRAPALAAQVRERPLPPDVLTLIRIAAGDATTLAKAAAASGEAPQPLVEATLLFLQQALFAADADSYRLLGVPATASQELLKQHHRWLVRWLHPDRQTDDWQAAYMNRVNKAWQDLRTPERRHGYDNRSRHAGTAFTEPARPPVIWVPLAPPERSRHAQPAARGMRLSPYLLGAVALCAGAALSWQSWNQRATGTAAMLPAPAQRAGTGSELPAALAPAPAPTRTVISTPAAPPTRPPPAIQLPSPAQVATAPARATSTPAATPQRIAALDTPGTVDAAAATQPAPPQAPDHPSPVKAAGHAPATPPPKKTAIASTSATPAIRPGASNTPPSAPSHRPIGIAPGAVSAPQFPPAATTAVPDARLQALPTRLADAYQRGDLATFVGLFSPQIQTEHGGYAPTTTAYQVLFASSTQRTLTLHDIRWQRLNTDRATGRGRFERTVHTHSQNASQQTFGTVVLDVITPQDDAPLLAGLRFEDAP